MLTQLWGCQWSHSPAKIEIQNVLFIWPFLGQHAISEFQKPSLSKWGQVHNFYSENEFYLHQNKKSFPYQRLSTSPFFDTEAQGNLEMAHKKAVFTSLGGMLANQQSNGPYFQVQKTLTFKMLEAKCKTLLVKMSFICMRGKIHFHINTFAFSLALKQKLIIIYF